MGGHGGLNITLQKSYAPYSRANRDKVARDERRARETEEAAEGQRQFRARAARLAQLRGNTRKESSASVQGHINFFEDVERSMAAAAEDRKKQAAARAEEERMFPELHLGRAANEDTPWYARVPEGGNDPKGLALPLVAEERGHVAFPDDLRSLERAGPPQRTRPRHDGRDGRKGKRRRSDSGEEKTQRTAVTSSAERLARLRTERLERERSEQRRAAELMRRVAEGI